MRSDLLDGRGFEFALERAVFVSVLHQLFVFGSDRSCEKWMRDYTIPGIDDLRLHHLYRAMAWLGEELEPVADGELAPRCVKDEIEERPFERQRDLFTDLSLVFMDTTSLSFHGAGGESLGAYGHSKDHRPDLRQMVLAVVLDGEGRPVCTEMLPGNAADTTVLLPIVDRLRKRFWIARVCVMADRGMISAATIAALEERGLDYIRCVPFLTSPSCSAWPTAQACCATPIAPSHAYVRSSASKASRTRPRLCSACAVFTRIRRDLLECDPVPSRTFPDLRRASIHCLPSPLPPPHAASAFTLPGERG